MLVSLLVRLNCPRGGNSFSQHCTSADWKQGDSVGLTLPRSNKICEKICTSPFKVMFYFGGKQD